MIYYILFSIIIIFNIFMSSTWVLIEKYIFLVYTSIKLIQEPRRVSRNLPSSTHPLPHAQF